MTTKISVLPAAQSVGWTGRAILSSPVDGIVLMTDTAGTSFTAIAMGGTSSAYPRIVRSGATLSAQLADGSGKTTFSASAFIADFYVKSTATTVGSLVAAATAGAGARAFVTDATSATFGAAAVGSGANKVPVYSDGTSWFVG